MTTQPFLNSVLFTTELKMKQSTHCSVHILECSV